MKITATAKVLLYTGFGVVCCGQALRDLPPPPSPDASVDNGYRAERQEKVRTAKWSVRIDVQMVAMPQASALKILPALRSDDPRTVNGAVATIQSMIEGGDAILTGWPMLVTLDGVRAVAETITEKRYPTEFSPPIAGVPSEGIKDGLSERKVPLVPNAFETRNVGVTLEAEPTVLDDGERIVLDLVPQRVVLNGMESYVTGKLADGSTAMGEQPEFATAKATSTFSVRNDEPMLLAVHQVEVPAHDIEFFIVRAVTTKL